MEQDVLEKKRELQQVSEQVSIKYEFITGFVEIF